MADVALAVYLELAMADKVRLLKNPHGRLSPGLIEALGRTSGAALFTSDEPKGTGFRLAATLAEQLDHIDGQFEEWWADLDPDDQDHLMTHCDQDLDATYATLVLAAGGDDDGLVVAIDQNSAGGFRLAGLVEVFVVKKASQRRP
jgi:hypothetical protein